MTVQYIDIKDGQRLVVIPEAEYLSLIEAAEDVQDIAAVREFHAKLSRGEEELIPAAFVNRMLAGESKVRVWREYRAMTVKSLAQASQLTAAYLSQIETGAREGTVETLKKIASALKVSIDDLV